MQRTYAAQRSGDRAARAIMLLALLVGCTQAPAIGTTATPAAADKIGLDLSEMDDQGLVGPSDGRRALDYEFCIPASPDAQRQVTQIDPTARVYPRARGRSRCGYGTVLVIGSTHQPDARGVLLRLASLDYVNHIAPCVYD